MPRASWCRPEIYDFFDRWRSECLIGDGALFTAGHVWSDENLSVLQTTLGTALIGEVNGCLLQPNPATATPRDPGEQLIHRWPLGQAEELPLTRTEFQLLSTMAAHPGRIFSRESLLTEVWGYEDLPDSKVVDMHVHRLRLKLEPDPARPQYVTTVRGRGYRVSR